MIMSRKIMNTDVCYTSVKEEIKVHSFSSTLLEAIYRSIDREERRPDLERKKKQTNARERDSCLKREEIEKWMEKRTVSSGFQENPRRRIAEANKVIDKKIMLSTTMARNCTGPLSSSSHSSDSSNISVERECPKAISKIPKSKSTNSGYQIPNPNIRATANDKMEQHNGGGDGRSGSSHFVKTKSHALKFYKEIKKMKQPISPGGRIATLINSLFVTGHSKKAKYTNENEHHHQDHARVVHHQLNGNNNGTKSTCSSASSISRSCLSHKTSSSSASSNNKATRSVRFSSPSLTVFNEQKAVKIDESCDVMANDIQALLRKYHNEDLFAIYNEFEVDQDGDEDEVSSCDSSDLFELDHLMGPVGMEAELPVYETTTRLDANRPIIANSLLA